MLLIVIQNKLFWVERWDRGGGGHKVYKWKTLYLEGYLNPHCVAVLWPGIVTISHSQITGAIKLPLATCVCDTYICDSHSLKLGSEVWHGNQN